MLQAISRRWTFRTLSEGRQDGCNVVGTEEVSLSRRKMNCFDQWENMTLHLMTGEKVIFDAFPGANLIVLMLMHIRIILVLCLVALQD